MKNINKTYKDLVQQVLIEGSEIPNKKRGTTRLEIPGFKLRHDMTSSFPALGLKKLPFKSVVGELIWFLRGDNDVKYLNDNSIYIWNDDAYNWHKKECKEVGLDPMSKIDFMKYIKEGNKASVGQNYSVKWNNFHGKNQIESLIDGMKKDIYSSRNKVNAWDASELDKTALPPCHDGFQIVGIPLTIEQRVQFVAKSSNYTSNYKKEILLNYDNILKEKNVPTLFYYKKRDKINKLYSSLEVLLNIYEIPKSGFELHWNQRSVDLFLGLPFNIASYATLGKILESITGYPFITLQGDLHCVHLYENAVESAKKLVKKQTNLKSCSLNIKHISRNFHHVNINDFELINYESNDKMLVKMLAPKEI